MSRFSNPPTTPSNAIKCQAHHVGWISNCLACLAAKAKEAKLGNAALLPARWPWLPHAKSVAAGRKSGGDGMFREAGLWGIRPASVRDR